ncbi:MAG: RagB/SusD family nutrient uptake outer membrane protein [Sphingobacteriales bacterium]
MKRKINYYMFLTCLFLLACTGCKKLVEVPEPVNSLTTAETFSTDANATSAIIAIYNDLTTGGFGTINYANGYTTFLAGCSADEFTYSSTNTNNLQFQNNNLQSNNAVVSGTFWTPAYFDVYMCNAAVEALNASTGVTTATKNQLLGEAKFLRAYVYFYLVNMFGNIPLTTTSAYTTNNLLKNSTPTQVYQQIFADLKDAQTLLANDYSYSKGERIRANKWAATALLARAYLYYASVSGDATNFANAATQASAVIANSSTYSLVSNLNNVFLKNSAETIWQIVPNSNSNYATWEGLQITNGQNSSYPTYDLTINLLNAFESNDRRKTAWTYSKTYLGVTYYGPYKYKVSSATASNIPEYYMMLRLAEQYLIRAEAEAQQNDLPDALSDLNTIRTRAGLPNLSAASTQPLVIAAVAQERRIELFGEWGHRWFDLKRTGQAISVLSAEKGFTLSNNALLWPIPYDATNKDPNLQQNPGY